MENRVCMWKDEAQIRIRSDQNNKRRCHSVVLHYSVAGLFDICPFKMKLYHHYVHLESI